MNDDLLRSLRIAMLWSVPPRHLRRVLELLDQSRLPFPWREVDLLSLVEELPESVRRALSSLPSSEQARAAYGIMRAKGVRFLDRGHPAFPKDLLDIPDPPPFLFLRGEPLREDQATRVAVVGSRAASAAGREIAYSLGRDLALSGCVVVSGLARGIDGEAHRGALDAGGRSVAVLGTGADVCYPSEHEGLFYRILRRGGAVTEFPPGTAGLRLHFPRRNRILAGLCAAVVVVEGGERSGARSTVDHALDQGKEVMAVPRDILHPGSALPNALLRDGARPVLSARDVLEGLFGVGQRGPSFNAGSPGGQSGAGESEPAQRPAGETLEARLLGLMGTRRIGVEECLRRIPEVSVPDLQAALQRLEVMGWIVKKPGGLYLAAARSGVLRERETSAGVLAASGPHG